MARKNNYQTTEYRTEVYGNVIRKVNVEVPNPQERTDRPMEVPRRNRRVQRNTLSIPYCVFLAVACVLTLVLGAYFLQQQALITKNQKDIAKLEENLAELKKANADELNRIETSINLEEIRETAINELGMIYATEENVVLYENTRQNHVSQYEDVPQEEKSLVESMKKSK